MSTGLKSKRRRKLYLVMLFTAVLVGFLLWAYYPSFLATEPGLTFKIEGFLDQKLNFRDAGASINQCAGQKILPEDLLLRSSGFFSGWSCDRVGNPDFIYSLNYSASDKRQYYCRGAEGHPNGLNIGIHFQSEELSDLEFIETWEQKPDEVMSVCSFISEGLIMLRNGKRILLHCEAGRDRTGAVVALLAAYQLEEAGTLSDSSIAAIECDYRRSKSLDSSKHGRIEKFLRELRKRGGVRKFLKDHCGPEFIGI